MESYQIEWRKSTKRDLKKIPPEEVTKIISSVEALKSNPRPVGSVKLSGSQYAYRIRIGNYRVIYEIYDHKVIIEVVKVGHRRDIYR